MSGWGEAYDFAAFRASLPRRTTDLRVACRDGDPISVDPVDADPQRGAFMAPVLLLCDDADRSQPHEIEAFGPVTTIHAPART